MQTMLGNWLSRLIAHCKLNPRRRHGVRRPNRVRGRFELLEDRQLMAALAFDPGAQEALRSQLLDDVAQIADMGAEGTVAVFGQNAASVLRDDAGRSVVAAADSGRGRTIAAASKAFVDFANPRLYDTARFYENSLDWVSHGLGKNARIVTDLKTTKIWLQGQGYSHVTQRSDWENGLGQADVLVTYLANPTRGQQDAVTAFLAAGGGMFVGYAGTGFGNVGLSSLTAGGNVVLRRMGLSWTETAASGFDGTLHLATPAGNALLAADVESNPRNYTAGQVTESLVALRAALGNCPPEEPQVAAIRRDVLAHAATATPTPSTPVSDPDAKVSLQIEAALMAYLPPSELFVHRTASSYGTIPAEAPRVTATRTWAVSGANAAGQWLSTGLYAVPGEPITVAVPESLVAQGWKIRIGSHADNVSAQASYLRMPTDICRSRSLDAATVQLGTVYGGVIYLVKPETSAAAAATYNVTIAGAVEAPYFVLGQTTDQQWRDTIRDLPAPYAELAAPNLVITLHAKDIRKLDNPSAVMAYWQQYIAAQDDLGNTPNPRTRPERINDDLQISMGLAHSGYPVATYGHYTAKMVDSKPENDSVFGHEFGHNHQSSRYTFSSEGEVTCNIFKMYATEMLTGTFSTDASRAPLVRSFIAEGRQRADHASEAQMTYAQLRAGFGWEPFKAFFRQLQSAASADQPHSDQEKRDQWVTRFSQIVGKNLGPFFQAWGFRPSQAALDAVAGLPQWTWIEAATPDQTHWLLPGYAVTFDPRSGFADITADRLAVQFANAPAHGTLTTNADGSLTYSPAAGWNGREVLTFTVTNTHGGVARGTVTLNVLSPGATASPAVVTGKTTALSVSGIDDQGQAGFVYTWSVAAKPAGAPDPTFKPNRTAAARDTTVTFQQAGSYELRVTVADAAGRSATAGVTVNVAQSLTRVTVTPAKVKVNVNGTQQFSALAYDQFGRVFNTPPVFQWSIVSGPGTLTADGLFTAPGASGTSTVRVGSGGLFANASVTTVLPVPAAPSGLAAAKLADARVSLTWTDNSPYESNFCVQTSTDGKTWTKYAVVDASPGSNSTVSFTTDPLARGKRWFRVFAFNASGNSRYSNTVALKL